MNTLDKIREENKHYEILDISDSEFDNYGKLLEGYDLKKIKDFAERNISIPEKGSYYIPSNAELETFDIIANIKNDIYAGLPIQVGESAGHTSSFSAFEFHQGSEVLLTLSDIILVLGERKQIKNGVFNAEKQAKLFYVPAGSMIELYSTTLHYSPCQVYDIGFKTIIILIKGTNKPLEENFTSQNKLVVKQNKFQAVHNSRLDKIEDGVDIGISGKLIEINYLSSQ